MGTGSLSSSPELYPNPNATRSLRPCEFSGPLLNEDKVSGRCSGSEKLLWQWLSHDVRSELIPAELVTEPRTPTVCFPRCFPSKNTLLLPLERTDAGPVKNGVESIHPWGAHAAVSQRAGSLFSSLMVTVLQGGWSWADLIVSRSDSKPIWCPPKNHKEVTFPRLWGKPVAPRATFWGGVLHHPLVFLKLL